MMKNFRNIFKMRFTLSPNEFNEGLVFVHRHVLFCGIKKLSRNRIAQSFYIV